MNFDRSRQRTVQTPGRSSSKANTKCGLVGQQVAENMRGLQYIEWCGKDNGRISSVSALANGRLGIEGLSTPQRYTGVSVPPYASFEPLEESLFRQH